MAYTFDTKQLVAESTADVVTDTYTCGATATLLVIAVTVDGGLREGGHPHFNDVPMSKAGSSETSAEGSCEIWYLLAPPTGSAYTLNIPNAGTLPLQAQISSYIASGGVSNFKLSAGISTQSSADPSLSVTPTSQPNLIVQSLFSGQTNAPTAGETLLYANDTGSESNGAQYKITTSTSAQTLAWTQAADDWCMVNAVFDETTPDALVQKSYRLYPNNDGVQPSSPYAIENRKASLFEDATSYRVRIAIENTGASIGASTNVFKLQYADAGSGHTNQVLDEDLHDDAVWFDVGGIGSGALWRGANNATPADGAIIDSGLLTGTTVLGHYVESGISPTNTNAIGTNDVIEYDWVINSNGVASGTYYVFRVVNQYNTPLSAYTEYPRLATTNDISGHEQHQWSSVDDNEVELGDGDDTTISIIATNDTFRFRIVDADGGNAISGGIIRLKYYNDYANANADTNGTIIPHTATTEDWEYWEDGTSGNWYNHGNLVTTVVTSDHNPVPGFSFEHHTEQGDAYTYDWTPTASNRGPEMNFSLRYKGTSDGINYLIRIEIDGQLMPISSMHWGANKPMMFTSALAYEVSVNDSLTVTENVTVSIEGEIGDLSIDVFESQAITENVSILNTQLGGIVVNDSVGIEDVPTVTIDVVGDLDINISDDVSMSEDITTGVSDLSIDVFDNQTVAETITLNLETVVERNINVNDSIILDDVVGYWDGEDVVLLESTTVSTVEVVGDLSINVNDTQVISESISIVEINDIQISDSITIADIVTIVSTPPHRIESGKVVVASDSTTSVSLVDVSGGSTTVTLKNTGYILAYLSGYVTSAGAEDISFLIDIDGTNSPELTRKISGSTDRGSVGHTYRSGLLSAGTYTIKVEFKSGSGTSVSFNNLTLVAMASMDNGKNDLQTFYGGIASDSTTSSTLEDIDGLAENVTTIDGASIIAMMALSCTSSTSNKIYTASLNIGEDSVTANRTIGIGSDEGVLSLIDRNDNPLSGTPTVVKGQHAIDATTGTASPVALTGFMTHITAFGTEWSVPNGHFVATDLSTTSAVLEDISGVSIKVELQRTSHITAFLSLSAKNGTPNSTGQFALNINGIDYEIIERFFTTNNDASIVVVARTTSALSPGEYTIKGRWNTDSGTLNSSGDVSITAFGMETSKTLPEIGKFNSVAVNENVAITNSQLGDINVVDNINIVDVPTVQISAVGDLTISVSDTTNITENVSIALVNNVDVNDSVTVSESINIGLPPEIEWLDDFDDNNFDTNRWVESENSGSLVVEQNGRLELTSTAVTSGYVKSIQKYVPQNTELIIKVNQHSTDGGFKLCATDPDGHEWDVYNENDWYNFQTIASTQLSPSKKVGGIGPTQIGGDSPTLTVPYWMRMRIDDTTIYFDYSDQTDEPVEGEWTNISSEVWSLDTLITDPHFVFITAYDTPTTGSAYVNNFRWNRFKPSLSVNEDISVTELVTTGRVLNISTQDTVSVAENIDIENIQLGAVDVFDSIETTEIVQTGRDLFVWVNDFITISENVDIENIQLGVIDVFNSISIDDVPTIDIPIEGVLFVNINDNISVAENINIENIQLSNISINDYVSISEDVQISKTSADFSVTVNDSITVTEFVGYFKGETIIIVEDVQISITVGVQELSINVFDEITITEDIVSVASVGDINVNDIVSALENVSIVLVSNINIVDSISILENVIISNTQLGGVSVSESISVVELITVGSNYTISTSDSVSILEDIIITNTQLGGVSVNGSITISETISVENNLNLSISNEVSVSEDVSITNIQLGGIDVSDLITISENISLLLYGGIEIFDDVSISEDITITNTQLGSISVSDSISVTELVAIGRNSFVSVNDIVTVSENVVINNSQLGNISVNDSVSIAENISIKTTLDISVNDNVGIAEDVVVENIQSNVSIFDSVSIGDAPTITRFSAGEISINVNDNVPILESITIENILGGIDVSDSVSIAEQVVIRSILNIETSDSVNASEDVIVSIEAVGDLSVSVNDSVVIAELIITGANLFISTQDGVGVVESVSISNIQLGGVSTFDSIIISEFVNIVTDRTISISEDVVVSENIVIVNSQLGGIGVNESVSIGETITTGRTLNITASDVVTINENVVVDNAQLGGVLVWEVITIAEVISTDIPQISNDVNISDSISISENVDINTTNNIFVRDVITVTENVLIKVENLGDVDISDSITISEDIEIFKRVRNPYFKKRKIYTISRKYRKKRKLYESKKMYKKKPKVYCI